MADAQENQLEVELQGLIADARSQTEHFGPRVGPTRATIRGYEIVRELRRGGQGVVYLAHHGATQRHVAIKILREGPFAGLADRARFEREVQILASLKHPNIVAIHDSGVACGSFYYVMDYIVGMRLDEWADACRSHAASSAKRGSSITRLNRHRRLLSAFIKICNALNVAHQRGVIHRDLKPTNILVGEDDEPYVLDFGLAKLISPDADTNREAMLTATGQFLGTLVWSSPEQVEDTHYHADTRSDVHALGLMLYRTLTGRMPYAIGPRSEMVRAIREQMPPRPSTVADEVDDDLETIILKCLSKDPERRYQTAAAVANDLRSYLANEPIGAKRESGWYMLRMLARRHRTAVTMTAAFATLLVATSIMLGVLYSKARENEQLALRRAAETQRVAEFQATQLAGIDVPGMGIGLRQRLFDHVRHAALANGLPDAEAARQVDVAQASLSGVNFTDIALTTLDEHIFQDTGAAIDTQFAAQPLVRASLLQSLADTLRSLGLFERAMSPQTEALAIRRRLLGNEHPDTLASVSAMGALLQAMGQLGESARFRWEALQTRRNLLGTHHLDTLASLNDHGSLLVELGRFDEARPCLDQAVAGLRDTLGEEHPQTLTALHNSAYLLKKMGALKESLQVYNDVLHSRRRVLGSHHASTLNTMNTIANLLEAMGKTEPALQLLREALDGYRSTLGNNHPGTLRTMNSLGKLLSSQGSHAEAGRLLRDALDGHRRLLGPDHLETIICLNNLAQLHQSMGQLEDALPYQQQALDSFCRVVGNDHPYTLTAMNNMGGLLSSLDRRDEAVDYYQRALEGQRHVLGDDHPTTLNTLLNLGKCLQKLGRVQQAQPILEEALTGTRRALGEDHPLTLNAISSMGALCQELKQYDEALKYRMESVEGHRRVLGNRHRNTLGSVSGLGRLFHKLGRLEEAEPLLLEAATHAESLPARDPVRTQSIKSMIAFLLDRNAADPQHGYLERAHDWQARLDRDRTEY